MVSSSRQLVFPELWLLVIFVTESRKNGTVDSAIDTDATVFYFRSPKSAYLLLKYVDRPQNLKNEPNFIFWG
jgi:hypothetical protein